MTTVLLIAVTVALVFVVVNQTIQQRINAAHQRSIDAHIDAINAINRVIAAHQISIDTLRGIRR